MKLDISALELSLMLGSYLRYSLGRQSYKTGACADTVRKVWKNLHPIDKEVILTELETELHTAESQNKLLGMDIDHAIWKELYKELNEEDK